MSIALELAGVAKSFTMHLQGGIRLSVVSGVTFAVRPGECVVLSGPSGAGKSSVLKMIFGSYRCERGRILARVPAKWPPVRRQGHAPMHDSQAHSDSMEAEGALAAQGEDYIDVAQATPRQVLALRRATIGYVSQFLRAIPRVPAIDVVAEPLVLAGATREAAGKRAAEMLRRLNVPAPLWGLPPATFSGGEQQRVNIARGFLPDLPILLLDEPTASLDPENCAVVTGLIAEKKKRGTAIVAIVHDAHVRDRIADVVIDVTQFAAAA
jgi:alpha-D-ribose 1-methylphosphonate 5-triphosphate synthase subunit PhnL